MTKKKLNGVHMQLELEVKPKRKRHSNYQRAKRAVMQAYRSDKSSANEAFIRLIEAALRDEFEPLAKRTIKQHGTYLDQALRSIEQ